MALQYLDRLRRAIMGDQPGDQGWAIAPREIQEATSAANKAGAAALKSIQRFSPATVTFGVILTGAVGTVAVTFTAAAQGAGPNDLPVVGDIAIARPRAAFAAGLVVLPPIVSGSTVTLAIQNTTGGSLTPSAQTWDILLFSMF